MMYSGFSRQAHLIVAVTALLAVYIPYTYAFVSSVTSFGGRTALYVQSKSGGRLLKTDEDFASAVLANDAPRPVLAFFTAPWCGPCRLSIPVVKEIMKQFDGDIDVVEICTDDLPEVSENAGVVSIPTIQLYMKGNVVETIVGCVAKGVLANAVEKVLEEASSRTS